jgi:SAM-dependent methyltransferase
MMTPDDLDPFSLVEQQYSDPHVITAYTVGLFTAEEQLIDRFFTPGTSVLDIGCRGGRTTIHLAQKGYHVIGIDLSSKMIAAARDQARHHNVNVPFTVMDAVSMPFPPAFVDNILFSYNGFDQIPGSQRRPQVLADTFELLRPGGCFLLTARSGLALGRRSLAWIWLSVLHLRRCILHRCNGLELGDKIWRRRYHHYINPFQLKSLLRTIGYQLVYFNSAQGVLHATRPTFWTHFSNDRMLF